MFKNKENIIAFVLIALLFGNTFMAYRNYKIAVEADRMAREADRMAREEASYLTQNVPAWNATYQWAESGAQAGIFPTTVQIQSKLKTLSPSK